MSDELLPNEDTETKDVNHPEYHSAPYLFKQAIRGLARIYQKSFDPTNLGHFSERIQNVLNAFHPIINFERINMKGIKFFFNIEVIYEKLLQPGVITDPPVVFRSEVFVGLKPVSTKEDDTDVQKKQFEVALNQLLHKMDSFLRNGSGWVVRSLVAIKAGVVPYDPLRGSSFVMTPPALARKHAVTNINNQDEKCFMWAVLATLYPEKNHPDRVTHYVDKQSKLNFEGIQFPVKIADIAKFEQLNNLCVNVFSYEEEMVYPVRVSPTQILEKRVDLLLLTEGEKRHYVAIRSMSRLLKAQLHQSSSPQSHFCPYCLHGCKSEAILSRHIVLCQTKDAQLIRMPVKGDVRGNNKIRFKRIECQLRIPFIAYADFESILEKREVCLPNPEKSYTEAYQHHKACSFAYTVISDHPSYRPDPVMYRGPDAAEKFIDSLQAQSRELQNILENVVEMTTLTDEQKEAYNASQNCHICRGMFDRKKDENSNAISRNLSTKGRQKVQDHCHLTGQFRGAAHNHCNLQYRFVSSKFRLKVVLHGGTHYDFKLILAAVKERHGNVDVIARNSENFIRLQIGNIEFIDSFSFMNSSLANLAKGLNDDQFHVTRQYLERCASVNQQPQTFLQCSEEFRRQATLHLTSSQRILSERNLFIMREKAFFPYDFLDSFDKFEYKELPLKEEFYNKLMDEGLNDEEYQKACHVFNTFSMSTFGDYHDLYLLVDVLLLSDIFENFRSTCILNYDLDPAHFLTAPSLTWEAALKKTDIELDLLTDPDQHLFIESAIRGGMSTVSCRHIQANLPDIPDYDPNKPNMFISYLDRNNLYGESLSDYLPVGDFNWLSDDEVDTFDVSSIPDDNPRGYIILCDLDYPEAIHDDHQEYPLAPEKMSIESDMLSPYQLRIHQALNQTSQDPLPSPPKLVSSLKNKENYTIHYRNLKYYLEKGMVLRKIKKVLSFSQARWLKPYIDFNTSKRALATSDFEKDFFKLLNNACFGKSLEKVRNRRNFSIVNDQMQLKRAAVKPSFKNFIIVNEDIIIIEKQKIRVELNRPIAVGFSVLDLSKLSMFQFHYDYIKQKYPGDQSKLAYTDTDSLLYEIVTEDLYEDMKKDGHLFDFSNMPKDHKCYSEENRKVIGKMKDEMGGALIERVTLLKSKVYAIKYGSKEIKKAKGVRKNIVKKNIRYQTYEDCLFNNNRVMLQMRSIKSFHQQLKSVLQNKLSLTCYDDKRYILADGIHTLPHGHFRINPE